MSDLPKERVRGARRPGGRLRGPRAATALVIAATAALAACGGSGPVAGTDHRGTPISAIPSPSSDLQDQFVRVVRDVSPKVVQIQSAIGLGSGVVFDGRGHVVTNAHVVQGGGRFIVTLAGGERHPATLLGADKARDLAVVRLVGATPPRRTSATPRVSRSATWCSRSAIRSACARA
jgi:putative serine protease PepD